MHFHLPKPLHGWRAFVGEVGIIVIGVLIALGAEQVVDEWRWHEKVGVVRQSLMGELANDRGRWETDMTWTRCVSIELANVDRWAAQGAPPAQAPPPPSQRKLFWMHSANWNLATGSEALGHFPIAEQLAFASVYDGVAHRQSDLLSTSDLIDRIDGLVPLAGDAAARRELRIAIGIIRGKIRGLVSNDDYMRRHFDAVGVKPDRSDFAADIGGAECPVLKEGG
jgi:hypothetical protein